MERRDRGQLFVLAALALAVLIVGVALLLNSGVYGATLAAQNAAGGVDEPREFLREAEIGANRVMSHANYNNFSTYGDLRRNFTIGVHNWSERAHHHRALSGAGVEIREVNTTNGSRITQDTDDRQFLNSDRSRNWTPGTGLHGVRQFRMNITADSLVNDTSVDTQSEFQSSFYFRVNVTDATGTTRRIYVYRNERTQPTERVFVRVGGPGGLSPRCSVQANDRSRATLYLSDGLIGRDHCDQLHFLNDPPAPFSINYTHGNSIEGSYELFVNQTTTPLADGDFAGTHPTLERAIYSARISVNYTREGARLRGNRTATPDRRRFLDAGSPFTFSIPVGDRVTYKNGGNFETLNQSGFIKTYNGETNARGIGPYALSFDQDPEQEVPFTGPGGSSRVQIVDENSGTEELDNDARDIFTTLGIGQWNDSGPSVYYPRNVTAGATDDGQIVEINRSNGTIDKAVVTIDSADGVSAIAGIADVDGDTEDEMVYLDEQNGVKFLDDDGNRQSVGFSIPTTSTSPPIGTPGDFDGDGHARIPFVDASNDVVLLNATTGATTTLNASDTDAVQSPMASIDWDSDGNLEIIYVDQATNELRLIDDVTGTNVVNPVTDSGGTRVTADADLGVR